MTSPSDHGRLTLGPNPQAERTPRVRSNGSDTRCQPQLIESDLRCSPPVSSPCQTPSVRESSLREPDTGTRDQTFERPGCCILRGVTAETFPDAFSLGES